MPVIRILELLLLKAMLAQHEHRSQPTVVLGVNDLPQQVLVLYLDFVDQHCHDVSVALKAGEMQDGVFLVSFVLISHNFASQQVVDVAFRCESTVVSHFYLAFVRICPVVLVGFLQKEVAVGVESLIVFLGFHIVGWPIERYRKI